MSLVAKGNKLTMRAVPGARFFVPEIIYNKKRINFFKNATFIAKHDVSLNEHSQKFMGILRYFTLFTLVTSNVVHIEVTQNIVTANRGGRIIL